MVAFFTDLLDAVRFFVVRFFVDLELRLFFVLLPDDLDFEVCVVFDFVFFAAFASTTSIAAIEIIRERKMYSTFLSFIFVDLNYKIKENSSLSQVKKLWNFSKQL